MHTSLRSLGLFAVGALSALGALSLTHVGPAQAQSHTVTLAALDARVRADEAKINLQSRRIGLLQAQNAALRRKTAPLSLSGHDLTITGVNVHIVSGSGRTDDGTVEGTDYEDPKTGNVTTIPLNKHLTGLGNLIIGYDAKGSFRGDVRTGSHNLVLGDANNYSSYGGLITGVDNSTSGPYASVSGEENVASGSASSISGGFSNVASGPHTSVSGGEMVTALNADSWAAGSPSGKAYTGSFRSP